MHQNSLRSHDFLWLSLSILTLVTLSFLFTIHPQDYWWCLRVGQETLANRAVPTIETYSWSQAGQPIVYQPWLACVNFWLTYDLGGAPLTYLLRGILIGTTYGLLWFMARQESGPRMATILVLITGFASSNNWQMRVQLFAYPLFALCLYSLFQWQKGNNKLLWVLPAAAAFWANLHGSFILSFVLAGSAFVFGNGERKPLLAAILVMALGTLLNPHGLAVWQYVNFMVTTPSHQFFITEWFPPTNEGWQMNIFYAWTLAFAPLASLSPRKPSIMEWVLFLGFGWLAFSSIRYVIWFQMILMVLSARSLAGITQNKLDASVKNSAPAFNFALAGFFTLLALFYLPGIRENWWAEAPPAYAPEATPFQAVEWLASHPELPHPMWNDSTMGNYFVFALPSRPVWVDGRFYIYPPEQLEVYQKVGRGSPEWESILQREGVNLLFLSINNQPILIQEVKKSIQWCEEYRDEYAVIFSRCIPIR